MSLNFLWDTFSIYSSIISSEARFHKKIGYPVIESHTPSRPGLCFAFISGVEAIRDKIFHLYPQANMEDVLLR